MDLNLHSPQNPENPNSSEQQQTLNILPFSTISLSLPSILPSNTFFSQPKISSLFFPPSASKIPTQASSLTLSSSPSVPHFPKFSSKSTISNTPLASPLSPAPRRPLDPSNAAAGRRTSIVWFRNDLRVHDNECLKSANDDSLSVLPVFCFDASDYGGGKRGFDKIGANRAAFVIESVSDLRKNLQTRGSDLVVRIGKPETVLVELAKTVGADAVYAHRETGYNEIVAEKKVEEALKEEGVEVKYFWGSTLYHVEDLPFELKDMPVGNVEFRKKVGGLKIRETIAALDQIKGIPAAGGGDVEIGEIPSLRDLGITRV